MQTVAVHALPEGWAQSCYVAESTLYRDFTDVRDQRKKFFLRKISVAGRLGKREGVTVQRVSNFADLFAGGNLFAFSMHEAF